MKRVTPHGKYTGPIPTLFHIASRRIQPYRRPAGRLTLQPAPRRVKAVISLEGGSQLPQSVTRPWDAAGSRGRQRPAGDGRWDPAPAGARQDRRTTTGPEWRRSARSDRRRSEQTGLGEVPNFFFQAELKLLDSRPANSPIGPVNEAQVGLGSCWAVGSVNV